MDPINAFLSILHNRDDCNPLDTSKELSIGVSEFAIHLLFAV